MERKASVKTLMGVIDAYVRQDTPTTARKKPDAQVSVNAALPIVENVQVSVLLLLYKPYLCTKEYQGGTKKLHKNKVIILRLYCRNFMTVLKIL